MTKPFIANVELAGPFKILARQIWIKAEDRKPPTTGDVLTPKAVQAGSSDTDADVANLINRSGLRDRDADGFDEHSTDPAQMWRTAKGATDNWVEFDLGEVQTLGAISIFNYNDAWYTDRGVRQADISVWTQETGWRKIQDDMAIEQAQGTDDYDEPMFVKLNAVKAQKIRFDDLTSFGDPDYVGLSEVQFFAPRGPQAVRPTPYDGAVGARVSGLELAWAPGEGAQTHTVYLGTNPDDLQPLGKVEQAAAKLSQLNPDSKYFWRVDEVRADGSTTAGKTWSFTTGGFAGWWKLDETDGSAVADSSGNGHHAVIHGDPVWLPEGGKVGGALQFDGVDDYVDTGWVPRLPTWTVAAWIKSPAAPTAPVANGPVHCEENFQISWNHGDAQCQGAAVVRVGGTWHSAGFGELKADTWYHLTATYDGENLKAYKDGVLITDKADPSGDADSGSSTLKFGRHSTATDAFFAGTVDDVRIYSYALAPNQIQAVAAGETPSAAPAGPVTLITPPVEDVLARNLVAWWKLDESAGQDVADSAPQGHSGTIVGNATWQPEAGQIGGALEFDGNSYVRIADEAAFDLIGEVTVAAWIKVRAFDKKWQTIIAKGDNTWRLARESNRNSVQFTAGRVDDDRIVLGNIDVNDGQWHHIVGVGDANAVALYVDGVLDNIKRTPGRMTPDNEPVYIGENSEQPARGRFWNGWIDDVCVFRCALDANDVKALYAGYEPVALRTASSKSRSLRTALVAAAQPAVGPASAPGQPQAQIQPVSAETPAAEAETPGGRNWIALIVIIAVVGAIAGFSFFTKQKTH